MALQGRMAPARRRRHTSAYAAVAGMNSGPMGTAGARSRKHRRAGSGGSAGTEMSATGVEDGASHKDRRRVAVEIARSLPATRFQWFRATEMHDRAPGHFVAHKLVCDPRFAPM